MSSNSPREESQKSQGKLLSILQKILGNTFQESSMKDWPEVFAQILRRISSQSELRNEDDLLACNAFFSLLFSQCDSRFVNDIAEHFQQLTTHSACILGKHYTITDLQLFKLQNAHGYLQACEKKAHLQYDTLVIMFHEIYKHCMRNTRWSYFAYKVLYLWLWRFKEQSDTRYWRDGDCIVERKLEAIMFSNWFNGCSDGRKQNVKIFNLYLQIMSRKYDGFVEHIFNVCVRKLSWQCETKYIILAEVCQVWNATRVVTTREFLLRLCDSLTKKHLHSAGTRLYSVILGKLYEEEWKETFGDVIKHVVDRWESEEHKDHDALQSLFKFWLEPTIAKHRDVLPFLWTLCSDSPGRLFRSHLLRGAAKLHVALPQADEIDSYISDKEEAVRLNAFAVLCYRAGDLIDVNETNPFCLIEQFLWFNANTTTALMRDGIIKYFRILCSNILKATDAKNDCPQCVPKFMEWLLEYFLDCLDIGSCYQRKILALNLYWVLLSFTKSNSHSTCARHQDCRRYASAIEKHLKSSLCKFTNKECLFVLFRLVLDSALDIRKLAPNLILEYFTKDLLSAKEIDILYNCAWSHCNSPKFYKIESGAALMRVIACWLPFNEIFKGKTVFLKDERTSIDIDSTSQFLLNDAQCQLTQMKDDILKAIVEERPFYGVLTALLAVTVQNGPEKWALTPDFIKEVLQLLNDAVDFFLSALSTGASNTAYSSSFAEMGMAIDEKIKTSEIDNLNDSDELQLSPAHQVLMSCIWMSLKVSCQIASEIGILMQSDEQVRHSMDIIVRVLLKCRHKGVMESAGVAIANLARVLYNEKKYHNIPKMYVTALMKDDTDESLHLTRRGAGLSIMFHRLVVSDTRSSRPIVHFAVETLLSSLKNFSAVREMETGQDSPWAKRLHFLCSLVIDKQIHTQLISHMEDICLICFEYMRFDIWTVRNANLQLYGAVVPRLVGQCYNRGGGLLSFGDGYSVNHFLTHYSSLATHVRAQLHNVSKVRGTSTTSLRSYSSVAPILVLLSRLSTSGCDLVDYPTTTFAAELKQLVRAFLGNPMIHIRQLAAKAYTALTPAKSIQSEMETIAKTLPRCDANTSHGYLLTRGYLKDKLNDFAQSCANANGKEAERRSEFLFMQDGTKQLRDVIEIWHSICNREKVVQPCYTLKTLFLQESIADRTVRVDSLLLHSNFLIERVIPLQKIQPGFFQFVGLWSRLYVLHVEQKLSVSSNLEDLDRQIVRNILSLDCPELGVEFLRSLSHCVTLLQLVLECLMPIRKVTSCHQLVVDEMVTFALEAIKRTAGPQVVMPRLDKMMEEFNQPEAIAGPSSISRVRDSLILAFSRQEALMAEVLSRVFHMCTDERQSVRLTAAEYMEIALRRFAQLDGTNRGIVSWCCLILSKDEVAEIREIVSMSLQRYAALRDCGVSSAVPRCRLQHGEVVYQRLLGEVFRCDPAIAKGNSDFVRCFTRSIRDGEASEATLIESPFNHEYSSFHREESTFLNIYSVCTRRRRDDEYTSEDGSGVGKDRFDATRAIQTGHFRKLREKAGLVCTNLRVILYIKEMDYLAKKRNLVMEQ